MTIPETIANLRGLLANAGKHYDVVVTSKDIADLIGHLEARKSEKVREWWTVAEKMPTADEAVLVWVYNAWEQAYYLKDYWLSSSDSSTIKGMSMSDIWRLMPEAPVIGEGK